MCGSAAIWMQIQLLWRKKKIDFSVSKKLLENCFQLNDAEVSSGFFSRITMQTKGREKRETKKDFFNLSLSGLNLFPSYVVSCY